MGFDALAKRLPEWGRLFDEQTYVEFVAMVRAELERRGETFRMQDSYVEIAGWDLPLLPLAQRCSQAPRESWQEEIGGELDRRVAEEKLGRELDALRGDFEQARSALKLRIQRAETLGPTAVSAPVAGVLHAVLVLDLPSFVTPVRQADLAAWQRPADQLVRLAVENVKTQERVEVKPMEISGARIFAVSGRSVFVATLGLAAEDLVGSAGELGALVAMPSAHILLCHSLEGGRSMKALHAMAAGSLQAFEGGPAPLSPDLLWKRGDRFVALPVRREEGDVKCELPREFDEQVVQRLS
jgi:hypothetical protein